MASSNGRDDGHFDSHVAEGRRRFPRSLVCAATSFRMVVLGHQQQPDYRSDWLRISQLTTSSERVAPWSW